MQIITSYRGLAAGDRGASVAIGNFDGVHRGHQVLLKDAAREGGGAPLGALTFEPHPRRLFQPDAPPFALTTAAEKARILKSLGVQRLYQLTFDRSLASMAAEDFVRDVLADGLGLHHVVVGADFRFGKGRSGDTEMLREMGAALGFGVTVQALVGDESGDFASSAIRELVVAGRCAEAAEQLGRWHTVTGVVQEGDRRGRDLGYPTANLTYGEQLVPCYGVYAVMVDVLDGPHKGRHPGVASLGERPTFGVNAPNFEAHLFDFTGDLYGASVSVALVAFLRGELKFDSAEALIRQMDIDSKDARTALAEAVEPRPH